MIENEFESYLPLLEKMPTAFLEYRAWVTSYNSFLNRCSSISSELLGRSLDAASWVSFPSFIALRHNRSVWIDAKFLTYCMDASVLITQFDSLNFELLALSYSYFFHVVFVGAFKINKSYDLS